MEINLPIVDSDRLHLHFHFLQFPRHKATNCGCRSHLTSDADEDDSLSVAGSATTVRFELCEVHYDVAFAVYRLAVVYYSNRVKALSFENVQKPPRHYDGGVALEEEMTALLADSCPNLRRIAFKFMDLGPLTPDVILGLFKSTKLNGIFVRDCLGVTGFSSESLKTAIASGALKSLCVSDSVSVDDSVFSQLLPHLGQFQQLILDNCQGVTSAGIASFLHNVDSVADKAEFRIFGSVVKPRFILKHLRGETGLEWKKLKKGEKQTGEDDEEDEDEETLLVWKAGSPGKYARITDGQLSVRMFKF